MTLYSQPLAPRTDLTATHDDSNGDRRAGLEAVVFNVVLEWKAVFESLP